ncbi:TerD family protein [Nocardia sp. CC227C]|uniref:TerD family protein n=1 Tax=Nocardia sp. CC227C TaxID=3044562 RepID=UPI00278C713B|nr:TerD family protein [Nocardia sp. CC227C]
MTLRDETEAALTYIELALGWDPAQRRVFGGRGRNIDLNAAALLFVGGDIVDVVYSEQLTSRDGAVRHHGDSLTGEGRGDNEVITVDLTRLSTRVTTVVFLVTCYTGQAFDQIDNAFCRLVDGVRGTELANYDLIDAEHAGFVVGRLFPVDGTWRFEALGVPIHAEHPVEAVGQMARFLT